MSCLGQGSQGDASGGDPVEQRDCCVDLVAGVGGHGPARRFGVVDASALSPKGVPGREPAEHLGQLGVVDAGDLVVDPTLESGERFVAFW